MWARKASNEFGDYVDVQDSWYDVLFGAAVVFVMAFVAVVVIALLVIPMTVVAGYRQYKLSDGTPLPPDEHRRECAHLF